MSVYYPTTNCGSGGILTTYSCNDCPDIEFGRVSGWAFIKTSFSFVDPSNSTEWNTGIANGDIIVIGKTQGSFDGGTPQELPGYGRSEFTYGQSSFVLTFRDPNYKNNCDFYNQVKGASNYKGAYVTSSQVHLINTPVSASVKNPVSDDLKSHVVWEVTVKWADYDTPCPYDVPEGIFDTCYIPL